MKFVNTTDRILFSKAAGKLYPGRSSRGTEEYKDVVKKTLGGLVKACGSGVGVVMDEEEAAVVMALLDLDQKGRSFSFDSLPREAREDPTGEKRAAARRDAAHAAHMQSLDKRNRESAAREEEANGETEDLRRRRPSGPATMEGDKFDPSMLKSGFDKIMEENRLIAEGGQRRDQADVVAEMLDPIGYHMKRDPGQEPEQAPEPAGLPTEPADEGEPDKKPAKRRRAKPQKQPKGE